jgi:uncharacterized damage-inducible protein DinB
MTDPNTIGALWQYMVHADGEMLKAAATLPEEGFFREQGISVGSAHKLLVHAVAAQRIWLERLRGKDVRQMVSPQDLPTLAAIETAWGPLHAELLQFAAQQTPESLTAILHGKNTKGIPFALPVGAVMHHVADHATYHRGQLNSMIKLAGGTPSPVMLYHWAMR